MKLDKSEYHPYAQTYIDYVIDLDPVEVLQASHLDFYENIASHKLSYRYGEGKWSIAEVLGHIIDTERIFSYRLLRIGRGDTTPMAGFEQDDYVVNAKSGERSWISLLDEYIAVRQSTLSLIDSFSAKELGRLGTASDHAFSARALVCMMAGHELHHIRIIKERYL
jgi:uncharacterized damage-inducible protein DinB